MSDENEIEDGEKGAFASRVTELTNGVFTTGMRRSMQILALYEADRCLRYRYSVLRPFQRKIALFDVCKDLIARLDFIPDEHKETIMFRTVSGKIPLTAELAWRRMRQIEKDITKHLLPKLKPLLESNLNHEELIKKHIQSEFEKHPSGGQEGLSVPLSWGVCYLPLAMVYKLYYLDGEVNPDVPEAHDPNPSRMVPNNRPEVYPPDLPDGAVQDDDSDDDKSDYNDGGEKYPDREDEERSPIRPSSQLVSPARKIRRVEKNRSISKKEFGQRRRAILEEVREHLDILKNFEGAVSEDKLNERKEQLFRALLPPPQAQGGER